MWRIPQPPISVTTAFLESISNVEDPTLKARLTAAMPAIRFASDAYDVLAQQQALHLVPRGNTGPLGVTKDEMLSVYKDRFAKLKKPGRRHYNRILAAAINARCPMCGCGRATQLDHQLPKAEYPDLALAPNNLVPVCKDCNKDKLARYPKSASEVYLHPYFEDVEGDHWLFARVVHTQPAALQYYVKPPQWWSQILIQRVERQFTTLKLASNYATAAAEELSGLRHQLEEIYKTKGAHGVQVHLSDTARSKRAFHLNRWNTAAYEAWSADGWFYGGGFR